MKPCVHTKPNFVRHDPFPVRVKRQPARSRLDKDELRQIEKQNYRLLMKLRNIHKNYSLYTPKKHMYLLKGEAKDISKPGKKPAKSEEPAKNHVPQIPFDNRFSVDEEMEGWARHLRRSQEFDLRAELENRERRHFSSKDRSYDDRDRRKGLSAGYLNESERDAEERSERPAIKNVDADDSDVEVPSDSDESDDEDDTAELLAELG